jgi:putative ABC transport system ATP-binding protein
MFDACASRGMTMVLVTHDAALARRCDAMIRVRDGHIETLASEPALGIA